MTATSAAPVVGPDAYVIQGQRVELPVVVRDASSGAATYTVSAAAARRLLPSDDLELLELWPGRALCSIAVIEYRDNDLGKYNEVSIAFFVRPKGAPHGLPFVGTVVDFMRGRAATYIHHLPVDGRFTCEAGRTIWGFPKTVEEIDFVKEEKRTTCRLVMQGQHVLTLSLPRGGARSLPDSTMVTFSYIDGAVHATKFASGGEGVGFHLGGAQLELGNHPISQELRSLGLPKRALMTMWMERMRGRFEAAERV
jgi:hypothetical protein